MAHRVNGPGLANAGREPIAATKGGSAHRDERTEEDQAKRDRLTDAFQGPSEGSKGRARPSTAERSWWDRAMGWATGNPQGLKQAAVVVLVFTAALGLLVLLVLAV